MTTGKSSNSISLPQRSVTPDGMTKVPVEANIATRCWTSAHRRDGLPNTAHENGMNYTQAAYLSNPTTTSYRTHGLLSTAVPWSQ